jgi:hypothetical protein
MQHPLRLNEEKIVNQRAGPWVITICCMGYLDLRSRLGLNGG